MQGAMDDDGQPAPDRIAAELSVQGVSTARARRPPGVEH